MNNIKLIVILSLLNSALLQEVPNVVRVRKIEDAKGAEFVTLDMIGLIERSGYPVEEHNVTTSDGYILNIYRIPWSPNSINGTEKKPVFFFMHGFPSSSDAWVVYGPNRSLAMQIADQGYDVWLGNFRGNIYGRAHATLSPDERQFWNFSYHELGVYDLPAMIDYVLETTNQSSLIYLGHSMGSTTVFVMLSEHPEYNEKIRLLIVLAPVSVFRRKNEIINLGLSVIEVVKDVLEPEGSIELFPQTSALVGFIKRICIPNNILDLCLFLNDLIFGKDPYQNPMEDLITTLLYSTAGSSAKTLWHFTQGLETGEFRKYDYGNRAINIRYYGQPKPPKYNMKNVRTPMIIYHGDNDPLSTKEEVDDLMENVSSKSISENIPFKYFNHIDFITARDVKTLLYDRLIKRLSEFEDGEILSLKSEDSPKLV